MEQKLDNQIPSEITSPEIIYIMQTIKQIQKRMKDPDLAKLDYISIYDQLGREFEYFFNRYTSIFVKVIRGESLNTVAAILFYKDKMAKGLITEEQLSEMLAKKYLPEDLKKESDAKIKEMRKKI
ncbi:MAG: hypothetical protein QXW79_00840 [Thermoplasmata archaeon]